MLVFISYSSKDVDFAIRLRDQLRAWGHQTWRDHDDIPKGGVWYDEIWKALQKADAVVAVYSPNSMASNPCKVEWDYAIRKEKQFRPLLLEPLEEINPFFANYQYTDFTRDEREGWQQLKAALEKQIAAPVPSTTSPPGPLSEKSRGGEKRDDYRAILLRKVREFWIEGVYEKNKIGDVWLDLPAEQRREAVEPQIKKTLTNPDYETITLKSGSQIADVFRRTGRALLILGAPGSGKTMTLLELAKDLVAEAERDEEKPIPMVVNLASWAEQQPELLEVWLAERLNREYGVSKKLAERLVGDGAFLWLLDGLDEVPEANRDACVTAINGYWKRVTGVDNGIVVCSRIEEYERLTAQLQLQNAIQLGALTSEQADGYLAQLGDKWESLRAALRSDAVLRELADSPLMLNIMAIAYRGLPSEEIAGFTNDTEQTQHLFSAYVERCLSVDKGNPDYAQAETRHYLAWLADKLVKDEKIDFQIEELQLRWLNNDQSISYSRLPFIFRLFVGLIVGTVIGFSVNLSIGLIVAFVVSLNISFDDVTSVDFTDRLNWSWNRMWWGLLSGLITGLIVGLVTELFVSLVVGSVIGLVFGLATGLESQNIPSRTVPNQGMRNTMRNWLVAVLVFGLAGGVGAGLIVVLGADRLIGLVAGLVFGFATMVSNGLLVGIMAGVTFGLVVWAIVGIGGWLSGGLYFGLVFGQEYGGAVVIRHAAIRRILWHSGDAPLNYAKFLKYTTEHGLTRQVGGGFVFRHRLLMEHFAKSGW